jgi:hypothetical protein
MPLHLIERFCVLCQVPLDWRNSSGSKTTKAEAFGKRQFDDETWQAIDRVTASPFRNSLTRLSRTCSKSIGSRLA